MRLRDLAVKGLRMNLVDMQVIPAGILLLICFNLAGIALARMERSSRETALRAAIGATPFQLAQVPVSEALILGMGGSLAAFGVETVLRVPFSAMFPRLDKVGVDPLMQVSWTLGIGLLASLSIGCIPLVGGLRTDLRGLLSSGGPCVSPRKGILGRRALVVAQVVLAMVVLMGVGLAARSLGRLSHRDMGLEVGSVLAARVTLPDRRPIHPEALRARLQGLPGVRSIGIATHLPLNAEVDGVGGLRSEDGTSVGQVVHRWVSMDYFATLGIGLSAGRLPEEGEAGVCAISEPLAHALWPGLNAVGRRISVFRDRGQSLSVVGVVKAHRDLDPRMEPSCQLFQPVRTARSLVLLLRTHGAPGSLVPFLQRALREDGFTIEKLEPLRGRLEASLGGARRLTAVLAVFGLFATLLAGLGVYGVTAMLIHQNRKALGIRLALGAAPVALLIRTLKESLKDAAVGLALGAVGAVGTWRVMDSLLTEISPWDLPSLLGSTLFLFIVLLAAAIVPTLHALNLPLAALLQES